MGQATPVQHLPIIFVGCPVGSDTSWYEKYGTSECIILYANSELFQSTAPPSFVNPEPPDSSLGFHHILNKYLLALFLPHVGLIESHVRGGVQVYVKAQPSPTFGSTGWRMKLNNDKLEA